VARRNRREQLPVVLQQIENQAHRLRARLRPCEAKLSGCSVTKRAPPRRSHGSHSRLFKLLYASRIVLDRRIGMFDILKELWVFLRERKKYWLMPIVLVLVAIGGILVAVNGSVIAPLIYTLF